MKDKLLVVYDTRKKNISSRAYCTDWTEWFVCFDVVQGIIANGQKTNEQTHSN